MRLRIVSVCLRLSDANLILAHLHFFYTFLLSSILKGVSAEEEVLLRFSLKESLYKSMHPLICQYVGFQEASVRPQVREGGHEHVTGSGGIGVPTFNLSSGAHLAFQDVTVHWRRVRRDYFLSTSSVSLRPESGAQSKDTGSEPRPVL
jgi:hypothetical protein